MMHSQKNIKSVSLCDGHAMYFLWGILWLMQDRSRHKQRPQTINHLLCSTWFERMEHNHRNSTTFTKHPAVAWCPRDYTYHYITFAICFM